MQYVLYYLICVRVLEYACECIYKLDISIYCAELNDDDDDL